MNQRAIILSVVLFALIIIGMFTFAFIKQNEMSDTSLQVASSSDDAINDSYANITRIDTKHFFADGVHTFVGALAMPTPCDLLQVDSRVQESSPEQVLLDFSVVNNAEFCPATITEQRFKVSATASDEATFSALFNNRAIELNIVEAGPDETPEDFELFIKG